MAHVDPIVEAPEVELVDDNYPTDKRQMVAEYIDENWNEQGGISLTQISDDTGTSRQHVKNTLVNHFERIDVPEGASELPEHGDLDREILELMFESYRRGYQDAQADAKPGLEEALENVLRD